MTRAPRRCLGCGGLTARGSRCPTCDAAQAAEYASPEYKALRREVLARDNYECQIERPRHSGQKCGRRATTVDHVVPKAAGGKATLENLVAACLPCNSGKRDR